MTTNQQRRLYRPEWNAAAKTLASHGYTKAEIDDQRLDIHEK